jgi:hypothetical protein
MPEVDKARLLRALAVVETSGGKNNWPRIEVSYIPVGLEFTAQGRILIGTGRNVNEVVQPRWDRWGLPSAASWGPWQILYHTAADLGYGGRPEDLWDQSEEWVVKRLGVIEAKGAQDVRAFADAWNSGSFRDSNLVPVYTDKVEKAYAEIL